MERDFLMRTSFFFLRHEEDVLDLDGVLVENSY